jgi:hypothetical protein
VTNAKPDHHYDRDYSMTRPKGMPHKLRICKPIPQEVIDFYAAKIPKMFAGTSEHVCWNVTRSYGVYGSLKFGGESYAAHRVSYAIQHGSVPVGMVVGHTCDNPRCINPNHLEAITDSQNARDAADRMLLIPRRGERAGTAKMTREQVLEAIAECEKTGDGYRKISKRLGLPPSAVKDVLSGVVGSILLVESESTPMAALTLILLAIAC